jgi:putative hydrolase of the HAD superfamily
MFDMKGYEYMNNYKCIMFDCMETIIDMTELPKKSDYALWAFEGSKCRKYFRDFNEFYTCYRKADKNILSGIPRYREYDFEDIYVDIMKKRHFDEEKSRELVQDLFGNLWRNYKGRCYVNEEVKEVISYLNKKYILGVVSNFKVKKGIEELLRYTDLRKYFSVVVNSSEEGWRKPHPNIYLLALKMSGVSCRDALFVGDDFTNDYLGPRKMGMDSILLEKGRNNIENCKKIRKFAELEEML